MDFYLKDLLEKNMATHSSILALEFHGQRSLMGYSPRDHSQKDWVNNTLLYYNGIYMPPWYHVRNLTAIKTLCVLFMHSSVKI